MTDLYVRENQTCITSWSPFFVAFAPLFLTGNLPFSGTGNPCFPGKSYYSYRISCMNPLFSPNGKRREQTVTRNGGAQIGACFIITEYSIALPIRNSLPKSQSCSLFLWRFLGYSPSMMESFLANPGTSCALRECLVQEMFSRFSGGTE